LIFRSQLKKAAVGRREMQLFLLGYALISLCEIFTVGGFPLDGGARRVRLPPSKEIPNMCRASPPSTSPP
jgi:hypothetical protein